MEEVRLACKKPVSIIPKILLWNRGEEPGCARFTYKDSHEEMTVKQKW